MNGDDYKALDEKIETLRKEFNGQMGGIREEIRELTASLREVVRIDGEAKRQGDLLRRLDENVDDLEERVRKLELARASDKHHEKLINWMYTGVASIVTGLVVAYFSK